MNKEDLEKAMISRLINSAKGHAQLILLDKNMPDETRKLEFEVIEEFVEYIKNYEEYKDWELKYTDDGR